MGKLLKFAVFLNSMLLLGLMVYTCNRSTLEDEMKGSEVQGQPAVHSEALSQHALSFKVAYYILTVKF